MRSSKESPYFWFYDDFMTILVPKDLCDITSEVLIRVIYIEPLSSGALIQDSGQFLPVISNPMFSLSSLSLPYSGEKSATFNWHISNLFSLSHFFLVKKVRNFSSLIFFFRVFFPSFAFPDPLQALSSLSSFVPLGLYVSICLCASCQDVTTFSPCRWTANVIGCRISAIVLTNCQLLVAWWNVGCTGMVTALLCVASCRPMPTCPSFVLLRNMVMRAGWHCSYGMVWCWLMLSQLLIDWCELRSRDLLINSNFWSVSSTAESKLMLNSAFALGDMLHYSSNGVVSILLASRLLIGTAFWFVSRRDGLIAVAVAGRLCLRLWLLLIIPSCTSCGSS